MRVDAARPRSAAAPGWPLTRLSVSSRTISLLATAAVGALALGVYMSTLAPTVMWYDMGEFMATSATLGIAHNTGYPLLILVGKAFSFLPVRDTAYRVSLMSAVFTALAVAVVFCVIHDLTEDVIASAVGALTLAFTSTVWANATWATSYGLNLFFTALVTRLMLAWWRDRQPRALAFAALAFGLGTCNHRLIVLVAPPSLLLLLLGWRSLTRRATAVALAAFVVGLSIYIYLPVRGGMNPELSWARPATWHTYWAMFLNGQTPSGYWRINIGDRIDVLWAYPSYDLTWAGLALAGVGAAVCARRQWAVAAYFLLLIGIDAVIVETYSIHNIYNYLTPGYLALCVLIGVAAAWVGEITRRAAARRVDVRPWLPAALLAACFSLLPAALVTKNYARVDRSDDYSARDFAQTTLDRLPPRAVVLTDSWSASPLWYLQFVEGQRRDVIVSPIFSVPGEDIIAFTRRQQADGRSVYMADGLRTPHSVLSHDFALQPLLLNGVEEMIVNTLPKPQYRDDLVATGSLYAVLGTAPETTVGSVPASAARDDTFDQGVTLVGFELADAAVPRGDVVQLTYYWRADRPIDIDLSAITLFFDASGDAQSVRGIPVWSQSRELGQGVVQTSRWQPGTVVKESYFALAPRTLTPGQYEIRIAVFDGTGDAARAHAGARHLVTIGHITVR
jgi:hypothetical protein